MLDGGDAQAQPRLMSEVKSRKKSVDPVSESESLVRQMWDMGLKDEVSNTIVSQYDYSHVVLKFGAIINSKL